MSYKDNPKGYTRCEKCKHIDRENEKCRVTNDNWLVSDRAGTCHQFEGVKSVWVKAKFNANGICKREITEGETYKTEQESSFKGKISIKNNLGQIKDYPLCWFEIVEDKIKNPTQVAKEFEEQMGKVGEMFCSLVKPNHCKDGKFDLITKEMKGLYDLKNKNYGNSFSLSYEEYGLTMVCIRLEDKLRRLKSLNKQGENANTDDESIRDTLIDLANYSVMAIMELDKQGGTND